MRRGLVLLSICLLGALGLSAQPEGSSLEVGIGLVGYSYVGDLTASEEGFRRFYPGGNLSLQFQSTRRLRLQANVGYGSFSEQSDLLRLSPSEDVVPNSFVRTNMFQADLRLRYLFSPRRKISPYLMLGIGLLNFDPRDADNNFLGENIFTRLPEESYNTMVAAFPMGAGVQARINSQFSVGLDYVYRATTTDYLDNIGLLGPKEGNDALHAVQMSLYISLSPPSAPRPEPQRPRRPTVAPPLIPLAWEAEEWIPAQLEEVAAADTSGLGALAALAPQQVSKPRRKRPMPLQQLSEAPAPDELIPNALRAKPLAGSVRAMDPLAPMPGVPPVPEEKTESPAPSTPPAEKPSEEPVMQVVVPEAKEEPAALAVPEFPEDQQFFFYPIHKKDKLKKLARRFKTEAATIQYLNQLSGEALAPTGYLRLPLQKGVLLFEEIYIGNRYLEWEDPVPSAYKEASQESQANETPTYLFLFIRVPAGLELAELASRYHIAPATLKALNDNLGEVIEANTFLRIPDLILSRRK